MMVERICQYLMKFNFFLIKTRISNLKPSQKLERRDLQKKSIQQKNENNVLHCFLILSKFPYPFRERVVNLVGKAWYMRNIRKYGTQVYFATFLFHLAESSPSLARSVVSGLGENWLKTRYRECVPYLASSQDFMDLIRKFAPDIVEKVFHKRSC